MESEFSYDKVAYPAFTFPLTHPDHLAVMGILNGLDPIDPRHCRVLELGCGSGANLLSFAYTLPDSRFLGIDLSQNHIADAKKAAAELNLTNVEFLQQDLLEFDSEKFGRFDFIIAHGLFSWVPDHVRDKMLDIYAKSLNHNGIGYLSYNVFPGCHLREIVQEAMQYHVAGVTDLREKAEQAMAFLSFLEKGSVPNSLHHAILKHELDLISDKPSETLIHDDLSEVNRPFYFHQMASRFYQHGLQYLSDSDPSKTIIAALPVEAREFIDHLGNDIIKHEQYFDFITGCRFRRSLVCGAEARINRSPSPEKVMRHFQIASKSKHEPMAGNGKESSGHRFTGPNGSMDVHHQMTTNVLTHLGSLGAKALSFDNLIAAVGGTAGSEADLRETAENLRNMFRAGFVKLYVHQTPFSSAAGETPHASDFARWQLRGGGTEITTLIGESMKVADDFLVKLIIALDGTRDSIELAREMTKRVEVEKRQRASFKQVLPAMITGAMTKLTEVGLLLPESSA